jgi:hypothetical protein
MGSTDKLRDKLTKLAPAIPTSAKLLAARLTSCWQRTRRTGTTSPNSFPPGTHMGDKTTMILAARLAESIRAE